MKELTRAWTCPLSEAPLHTATWPGLVVVTCAQCIPPIGFTDGFGQRTKSSGLETLPVFLKGNGMRPSPLIAIFAALRFATGIAAWLAPATTGRLLGFNSRRDQPFTTQLFGSRELTLAVAITDTTSPKLQTRALQMGLLTDVLDVIAAVRGIRAGTLSVTGTLLTGGGAALFAGLGLAALNDRNRKQPAANSA
jgi:hypothetical protein